MVLVCVPWSFNMYVLFICGSSSMGKHRTIKLTEALGDGGTLVVRAVQLKTRVWTSSQCLKFQRQSPPQRGDSTED